MRTITAERVVDLASLTDGWEIINVSVGPNADPVVLLFAQQPDVRSDGREVEAVRSRRRPVETNHYRIVHLLRNRERVLDLPILNEELSHVQPLGLRNWVVVRGLAWTESDMNAHVLSEDGRLLSSFHAGDAIRDVQVTDNGHIWMSYFDEARLELQGLVCFNAHGEVKFHFNRDIAEEHDWDYIVDCYGMNVVSPDETWLYYYSSGLPLIRLVEGQLAGRWDDLHERVPWASSWHAFAVTEGRVLFGDNLLLRRGESVRPDVSLFELDTDGFCKKDDRLYLVSLVDEGIEVVLPVDPAGSRLKIRKAFGRGSHLYLRTDEALYVVDAREVAG